MDKKNVSGADFLRMIENIGTSRRAYDAAKTNRKRRSSQKAIDAGRKALAKASEIQSIPAGVWTLLISRVERAEREGWDSLPELRADLREAMKVAKWGASACAFVGRREQHIGSWDKVTYVYVNRVIRAWLDGDHVTVIPWADGVKLRAEQKDAARRCQVCYAEAREYAAERLWEVGITDHAQLPYNGGRVCGMGYRPGQKDGVLIFPFGKNDELAFVSARGAIARANAIPTRPAPWYEDDTAERGFDWWGHEMVSSPWDEDWMSGVGEDDEEEVEESWAELLPTPLEVWAERKFEGARY